MDKKLSKKVSDLEDNAQYEDNCNEVPPEGVFTFNELRSCADLFRMYEKKILMIRPEYQRDIVWSNSDRTRFIDSLLKRLPIPSLCFSQDMHSGEMKVIDGLQRIDTVRQFFEDKEWKLSDLEDIDNRISGKTIKEVDQQSPEIVNSIEDFALPVTLLRCNYSDTQHVEYIFTIFRRLNTGGLKLTNQEIRNAIFSGSFNDLLKECNRNKNWTELLRRTTRQKTQKDRFRSIETTLKFFAFYDRASGFKGSLSNFLNTYMKDNRELTNTDLEKKKDLFNRTVDLALRTVFTARLRTKMSTTTFEAVLYGIAKNIESLELLASSSRRTTIQSRYRKLIKENAFSNISLSEGLYQKSKVQERYSLANSIFAGRF